MKRYLKVEKSGIGIGAYGEVYKATDSITGDFVAMKRIKASTEDHGISPSTLREISCLKALVHPNVVG
jgi:serine/threonine protein kinase